MTHGIKTVSITVCLIFMNLFSAGAADSWTTTIGGGHGERCDWVLATRDGGYLVSGRAYPHVNLLAKLDSAGNLLWKRRVPRQTKAILQVGSDFIVEGFDGLGRIDQDGNIEWFQIYAKPDESIGVPVKTRGGILVAGRRNRNTFSLLKIDFHGNPVWEKEYSTALESFTLPSVKRTGGSLIFAGSVQGSDSRLFLQKTDREGDPRWSKLLDFPSLVVFHEVFADSTGYLITGAAVPHDTVPLANFFIKFDAAGNLLWQKFYPLGNQFYTRTIARLPDGTYTILGGPILRLDSDGNILSLERFRLNHTGILLSFTKAHDGGIVVAGYGRTPINGRKSDFWITKTAPDGHVASSCVTVSPHSIPAEVASSVSVADAPITVTSVNPAIPSPYVTDTSDYTATTSGCD